jgi:RNA recognition motif-containing protein
MRIYVGNLSYDINEDELQQEFSGFGEVTSVTIPRDKPGGRSKGFGFVDMPTQAEAEAAIAAMNGKSVKGRPVTVSEARPRPEGGGGGERRPPRY